MTEAVRALDAAVCLGAPVHAVFSVNAYQYNIYVGDAYVGGVEFTRAHEYPPWTVGRFIGQGELTGVTGLLPALTTRAMPLIEDILTAGFIEFLTSLAAQPDLGTMEP